MQRYEFRGLNKHGRTIRGAVFAKSENDLSLQLSKTGIDLLTAKVANKRPPALLNRVKIRDLISFFLAMQQITSAGISLTSALALIRDSQADRPFGWVIFDIERRIYEGATLSKAMSEYPKIFKPMHTAIIKASEETGNLADAFGHLLRYMKWADEVFRRSRKALIYPMIVVVIAILTITVMLGFVVPQILSFINFVNEGSEIPFLTLALINTSNFFKSFWYIILSLPIIIGTGIGYFRRNSESFALKFDTYILQVPGIGQLMQKADMSRFCLCLSALYTAGIPLIQAIGVSRDTMGNTALKAAVDQVIDDLRTGKTMSQSFAATGYFPPIVIEMIKVGEETGRMSEVLDQIAEFYNREVDEAVHIMITSIEPTMIAILGFLITWIAAAVFGPIYSTFEDIQM